MSYWSAAPRISPRGLGRPMSQPVAVTRPRVSRAVESSSERCVMVDSIDQLGPVDYLVVEFPGSNFNGEIMPELVDLVERGVVRVLDLVVIKKDEDSTFEAFEFADIEDGVLGELRELEREFADLLSEDDIAAVVDAMEPGSTAGLLIYENLWAAPLASA